MSLTTRIRQFLDFKSLAFGILRKQPDGTLGSGSVAQSEVDGLAATLANLASDGDLQALADSINAALALKASKGAQGRTDLALGDSATRNVGTAADTVAAGDHGHSEFANELTARGLRLKDSNGVERVTALVNTGASYFDFNGYGSVLRLSGGGISAFGAFSSAHSAVFDGFAASIAPLILRGRASQTAPLLKFQQVSSTGVHRDAASIDAEVTNSADASFTSDLVIKTPSAGGALTARAQVGAAGLQVKGLATPAFNLTLRESMDYAGYGGLWMGTAAPDSNNFSLSSGGGNTFLNAPGASGNLWFRIAGATKMLINPSGHLTINDTSSVPSSNPTGASIVYVENGVLKSRNPAGAVAALLPVGTTAGTVAAGDDARFGGGTPTSIANGGGSVSVDADGSPRLSPATGKLTRSDGDIRLPFGKFIAWNHGDGSGDAGFIRGFYGNLLVEGTQELRIGSFYSNAYINSGTGKPVAVGGEGANAALHVQTQYNPERPLLILQGHATQTAPLLKLQQKSSTGTVRDAASIDAVWTDPADATRTSQAVISTVSNGGALTPHTYFQNGLLQTPAIIQGSGLRAMGGSGGGFDVYADGNYARFSKDFHLWWGNGTAYNSTGDIGLKRSAAGILKVTNGSTGHGSLDAGAISATSFDGGMGDLTAANGAGRIKSGGFRTTSSGTLAWSSGTDSNTGPFDTGLARSSAGIVKITDGGSNRGSLELSGLNINGLHSIVEEAFWNNPSYKGLALATTQTAYSTFAGGYGSLRVGSLRTGLLQCDNAGMTLDPNTESIRAVRIGVITSDTTNGGYGFHWSGTDHLVLNNKLNGSDATSANLRGLRVKKLIAESIPFKLFSSTGADRDAAAIDAVWTDATDATRTSAAVISTVSAGGALVERARADSTGVVVSGTMRGTAAVLIGPDTSNRQVIINSNGLALRSVGYFGWGANSGDAGGAADTGLARVTAGVVRTTLGSTGYGTHDALAYRASGTQVLGAQGAAVADATDAASAVTQLNTLLSRLRDHGLIASA